MDTYTVEFRIEGSTLIPQEVTKNLEVNPSQTSDTNKINRKREPFWAYDGFSTETDYVGKEWESLEEGLQFLLNILLPKQNLIHSQFAEYKKYWWCGFFQESFDGGPSLSPELLKQLANFNVELMIRTHHA